MNKPDKNQRTVVLVAFETEFAPSGGLGAVIKVLPRRLARRGEKCLLLAPHFRNITNLNKLAASSQVKQVSTLPSFALEIGSHVCDVEMIEITGADDFKTYLISCEDFFTAAASPYINSRYPAQPMHPDTNPILPHRLAEDALFFCAAAPKALVRLAEAGLVPFHDLVLHLQDWETACIARALRLEPRLQPAACVLTLHNPYDRYLSAHESDWLDALVSYLGLRYDNVLSQMIPLMDGPLSTVSQNFADELTGDPLHTRVFANHLQDLMVSKGIVGIDNGVFGEPVFPFSPQAHASARRGDFEPIRQEKWERRVKLGQRLQDYQRQLAQQPHPAQEAWGADLNLSDPAVPVFLVLGRDDPRQKGFDVIAQAIRALPAGRARYIFTPIPGDEGLMGLEFLKKLAQDRPGEVKVFPFRLDPLPFQALQQGSSFMVMGSLYEPFGAANEAYLAGMPVVARATGGLVQQVSPYPSACLSRRGRQLAALFHALGSAPTGFLFRELPGLDEAAGWRKIIECAYWNQRPRQDRIDERRGTPLFDAMVQSAAWALQHAIDFYTSDQAGYAEMIYRGFEMLGRFSWERAVAEYRRLYDFVCA